MPTDQELIPPSFVTRHAWQAAEEYPSFFQDFNSANRTSRELVGQDDLQPGRSGFLAATRLCHSLAICQTSSSSSAASRCVSGALERRGK